LCPYTDVKSVKAGKDAVKFEKRSRKTLRPNMLILGKVVIRRKYFNVLEEKRFFIAKNEKVIAPIES